MQSGNNDSTWRSRRPGSVALAALLWLIALAFSACQMPIQVQVERAAAPAAGLVAAQAAGAAARPTVSRTTPRPAAHTPTRTPAPAHRPQSAGQSATFAAPPPSMTPMPENAPTYTPTPTLPPTVTPAPQVTPASVPPDRIMAPAIGLDAPVVEINYAMNPQAGVSEWQTADSAAGFHHGTALPGHAGNTVISGHHNIKGKVFANLYKLQPQDEIALRAGGVIYRYQVEDAFIVPERGVSEAQREQNARWIAPTRDVRLTLVTCWPPDNNTHRVIVVARLVGEQAAG